MFNDLTIIILLWSAYLTHLVFRRWYGQRIRGAGVAGQQLARIPEPFVPVLFLVAQCVILKGKGPSRTLVPSPEFKLAIQWIGGVCHGGLTSDGRKCLDCNRNELWTIHGLWPKKSSCDHNETFKNFGGEKKSLERAQKFWPSCIGSNDRFWRYEWTKHGTCCMINGKQASIKEYFDKAIALTESLDMYNLLKEKDVVPKHDQTYDLSQIQNVIKETRKVRVMIKCQTHHDEKKVALENVMYEIRLCYNKDFKLQDCPTAGDCGRKVLYLPLTGP